MEIKKLNQSEIDDFRKLVEIFKNVFENEERISDKVHLEKLLS